MAGMKIALVGCGGMAANYRGIYTQIQGAELALVIDVNEAVAREAAAACGGIRWSTRFEDCLAPDIDIVDISTPNFLHREQGCAALSAGKHVLMQKPLANSLEDAQAIASAAAQSGKTTGMFMFLYDNPLFHDIKAMIDTGLLGTVSGVHCRTAHRGGLNAKKESWRGSREKTGGGSFIQLAIHNMNMAQWLIGSRVKSVMGYGANLMCPGIGGDDVCAVAYEYENGALGTVSAAFCAQKDELSICGSAGFVSVDDFCHVTLQLDAPFFGEVIAYGMPGERAVLSFEHGAENLYDAKNPHDQHVLFVRAAMEGKAAPIGIEVGLRDMMIVEAVHRSFQSKRRENVLYYG